MLNASQEAKRGYPYSQESSCLFIYLFIYSVIYLFIYLFLFFLFLSFSFFFLSFLSFFSFFPFFPYFSFFLSLFFIFFPQHAISMTRVKIKTRFFGRNWQDGLKCSGFITVYRNNIQLFLVFVFFLIFTYSECQ